MEMRFRICCRSIFLLRRAFSRSPTPETQEVVVKKVQLVRREPLKERNVGGIAVRMLETPNRFLAPRVEEGSREVRQAWLMGMRKHRNGSVLERRPVKRKLCQVVVQVNALYYVICNDDCGV